jgi:ribosomal protein S27E
MPENPQTSEKGRGKAIHEIIIDSERPSSMAQNQVSRILDEQTEMIAKKLTKSQLDALLAESERKEEEEKIRRKQLSEGQAPPSTVSSQPSEAKNILDAVRIGVEVAKPQQQTQGSVADMAKSIVEAIKIGVDMGKAQTQQPQQQGHVDKYLDLLLEELKLARQEQSKDRETRLEKEINELKNRPGFMDEMAGSAEKFQRYQKLFTGNSGGKTEIDLKHEEMQQTERLENRRITMEEEDKRYKREHEGDTVETVKEIFKTVSEGPIGRAIENMGGGAADRIRAGKGNNTSLIKAQCPQCHGQFMVNPALPIVQCNHCGTTLLAQQNSNSPPPVPQAQPDLTSQVTSETQPQNVEDTQQPSSPETNPQKRQPSIVTNIVDLNKS